MKKILLSILSVGVVGAVAFSATQAFFSDTETSTGNTFTAGSIDLLIDSTAHYNGMVCTLQTGDTYLWQSEGTGSLDPNVPDTSTYPELLGTACVGTWTSQDLGGRPFFVYSDLKPGDTGENTLSLTVNDNNAHMWARVVGNSNADNGLTEPESDNNLDVTDGPWCGELAQNMTYTLWIDDGGNGFGDIGDPLEGNNVLDAGETILVNNEPVLGATEAAAACSTPPTGTLATDWQYLGVIPGLQTWYYGVAWNLPTTVGNVVQSDSISFDMEFYAEQERNNLSPTPPTP